MNLHLDSIIIKMESIDDRLFVKRRLMFLCILGVIVSFLIIVVAIVIVTICKGKSLKQFGVYPVLFILR